MSTGAGLDVLETLNRLSGRTNCRIISTFSFVGIFRNVFEKPATVVVPKRILRGTGTEIFKIRTIETVPG